jgi:hypothetical protein
VGRRRAVRAGCESRLILHREGGEGNLGVARAIVEGAGIIDAKRADVVTKLRPRCASKAIRPTTLRSRCCYQMFFSTQKRKFA